MVAPWRWPRDRRDVARAAGGLQRTVAGGDAPAGD